MIACATCGKPKKALGTVTLDVNLCNYECPGYLEDPAPPHLGTGDPDVDDLQALADTRGSGYTVQAGIACVDGPLERDVRRSFKVISRHGDPLAIGSKRVVTAWLKGKPRPAPEHLPEGATGATGKAQGALF